MAGLSLGRMCGIVGCAADEPVAKLLLSGLRRVEYRGYDSAGMATISGRRFWIRKGVGKIADVEERLQMSRLPGKTGMAHCLHPSTYVQLADGSVTTIARMKETDYVLSLDPKTMKFVPSLAVKFAHPSPRELVRVRTESTELISTETHMMIVSSGGKIVEKMARDVSMGDVLILPKSVTAPGRPLRLPCPDSCVYYELGEGALLRIRAESSGTTTRGFAEMCGISLSQARSLLGGRAVREDILRKVSERLGADLFMDARRLPHPSGRKLRIPQMTSPKLMQIVGYFLGNGRVLPRSIQFNGDDLGLLSRYSELIEEVFSAEARIRRAGGGAKVMDVNSAVLRDWFKANFVDRGEEFVWSVGSLTEDEVAGFLRGLFDAKGTVDVSSTRVSLSMADERVVRTAQALLLRLGIRSSVRGQEGAKRMGRVWKLQVSGREELLCFLSTVGTGSGANGAGLEAASCRTRVAQDEHPPNEGGAGQPAAPKPGNTVLEDRGTQEVASSVLLQKAAVSLQGSGGETRGGFASSCLTFEKVTMVERVQSDTDVVYDLEVRGTRNFVANCVVTHNSRWATHGKVTDRNAHPHTSCRESVAIVHNGIIENYAKLKEGLLSRGHRFKSETDTEVVAHLLEEEYARLGDPVKAMVSVMRVIRGQYALAAIFQDRPGTIIGARKDAPLLVGVSGGKNFIASDVLAFIEHTDRAIFLDNMEVAEVTKDSVRIFDSRGREVKRKPTQVAWELADISKFDYAHYTLKEINEQPKTVASAHAQDEGRLEEFARAVRRAGYVFVVASGTSYHAGLIFASRLAREARVRCEAVISGEFREKLDFVDRSSVVIALSQSGETADVLEAVRLARKKGAGVLSIVNAAGSTLARESDSVLLLNCGPEVGVAATKSFTAQVVVSNMVVDRLLGRKGNDVEGLSSAVEQALKTDAVVRRLAERYREAPDFYFVARGQHYPVALEGALKMKELSYIHAEGMPASELKHGTLALIEKGTPVVVINPSGPSHEDTLSNAEELRARGADVIGVSDVQSDVYTHFVKVPRVEEKYKPVVEVIPLQLLAYWTAVARRNDPDYPRNLAKSVTVK